MINRAITHIATLLVLSAMSFSSAVTAAEKTDKPDNASLYNRLGGLAPISVVVDDFIDALVPDEELNANPAIDTARKRVPPPYLKYHVTAMVCQATGGPCQYHGRDMKSAHAHLHITDSEWDRMVVIFKEVLANHKVPDRESQELLDIIASTKADIVSPKSKN